MRRIIRAQLRRAGQRREREIAMGKIRELSEKLLSGEVLVRDTHPLMPTGEMEEVAEGVAYFRWFANVTAIKTDDGLVLVDTGAYFNAAQTVSLVRSYSPARVNSAIYTHGHVDHACGMPAFVDDAQQHKWSRPRVVGHRATASRFDRYKRTAGYNTVINTRQFSRAAAWPTEFVYPDTYFENQLTI